MRFCGKRSCFPRTPHRRITSRGEMTKATPQSGFGGRISGSGCRPPEQRPGRVSLGIGLGGSPGPGGEPPDESNSGLKGRESGGCAGAEDPESRRRAYQNAPLTVFARSRGVVAGLRISKEDVLRRRQGPGRLGSGTAASGDGSSPSPDRLEELLEGRATVIHEIRKRHCVRTEDPFVVFTVKPYRQSPGSEVEGTGHD